MGGICVDRDYLLGFSKRKAERRRHGLAMQKVKDRKHKLAQRQEASAPRLSFAHSDALFSSC